MLQCVAGCCRVLQSVAVFGRALKSVAGCCRLLQCVAVCCSGSVLQCVAECCSVLQSVVVCCRVLQRVAECRNINIFHTHHTPHTRHCQRQRSTSYMSKETYIYTKKTCIYPKNAPKETYMYITTPSYTTHHTPYTIHHKTDSM